MSTVHVIGFKDFINSIEGKVVANTSPLYTFDFKNGERLMVKEGDFIEDTNLENLTRAFTWSNTQQGSTYWYHRSRGIEPFLGYTISHLKEICESWTVTP